MAGSLTQTIENLSAAANQVRNISGLPQQAQDIVASALQDVSGVNDDVVNLTRYIRQYCSDVPGHIEDAQKSIDQIPLPDSIFHDLANIGGQADNLKGKVDAIWTDIGENSEAVIKSLSQLPLITSSLNAQLSTLNSQLVDAQDNEAKAKKRLDYLRTVDSMTRGGLGAAQQPYNEFQSNVNSYQNQINEVNSQMSALNNTITSCLNLKIALQDCVTDISSVQNEVQILSGYTRNISTDSKLNATTTVVKMALTAISTQVTKFMADAS